MSSSVFTLIVMNEYIFKCKKLFSYSNRIFLVLPLQYWAFEFAFPLDNTFDIQPEPNGEKLE